MSGHSNSSTRKQVVIQVGSNHKIDYLPAEHAARYYGVNSFSDQVMREKLPTEVYKKLRATIRKGEKLDMTIADAVAHAMKEWALAKGVTHFTHWFQPQTGSTAEKHAAFIEIEEDGSVGRTLRSEQLVQANRRFLLSQRRDAPDLEARGYTWDPRVLSSWRAPRRHPLHSSVFISYNDRPLTKTPCARWRPTPLQKVLALLLRADGGHRHRHGAGVFSSTRPFSSPPRLRITGRTLRRPAAQGSSSRTTTSARSRNGARLHAGCRDRTLQVARSRPRPATTRWLPTSSRSYPSTRKECRRTVIISLWRSSNGLPTGMISPCSSTKSPSPASPQRQA